LNFFKKNEKLFAAANFLKSFLKKLFSPEILKTKNV